MPLLLGPDKIQYKINLLCHPLLSLLCHYCVTVKRHESWKSLYFCATASRSGQCRAKVERWIRNPFLSSLFWWSAIPRDPVPSRTRRSRSSIGRTRRREWRRSFSRGCCVRGTDDSASRDAECWSVSITSLVTLPSSSWTTSNWSSSHPTRQPIRNQWI